MNISPLKLSFHPHIWSILQVWGWKLTLVFWVLMLPWLAVCKWVLEQLVSSMHALNYARLVIAEDLLCAAMYPLIFSMINQFGNANNTKRDHQYKFPMFTSIYTLLNNAYEKSVTWNNAHTNPNQNRAWPFC